MIEAVSANPEVCPDRARILFISLMGVLNRAVEYLTYTMVASIIMHGWKPRECPVNPRAIRKLITDIPSYAAECNSRMGGYILKIFYERPTDVYISIISRLIFLTYL